MRRRDIPNGRQLGIGVEGDCYCDLRLLSQVFFVPPDSSHRVEMSSPPAQSFTPTAGTRHHRLLCSNEVPQDSDLILINSTTSQIDARMVAIDEEIALLHRRVEQLTDERRSLIGLRSQNSAIVSLLRRIPAEILAEIFMWTLPLVHRLSERRRFSSMDSPWFLTHVSHRWRAVSISTSALWSVVAISYSPQLHPSGLYPLPMLETHVARAQKLKIHFYGHEASLARPQIEVFKYLASHSPRWEELSLSLTSALVPLLSSLQHCIPSLCRLNLQWSDERSQANVDSIDCFQRAPCLIDFAVFNEFRSIPIRLPVQQLKRYQLDGPWRLHRDLLVRGLNLVELRLSIGFDNDPWPDVKDTVQLPSLRRLYTSRYQVLDFLVAPALEEMALMFYRGDGENIQSSFGAFVERSKCTLRRLCLDGSVEADTVTRLLKDNKSITELAVIHGNRSNAAVLALLAILIIDPRSSEPQIGPQLESISIGCRAGCRIEATLYLEMVHSRWSPPYPTLKSVALLSTDTLGSAYSYMTSIPTFRKQGLNFLVQDGEDADEIMNHWTYHPSWN
ncbi:hypothetical protein C8R46DRAFT_1196529 [Mycena filopes]|nr:hypothetical protein C8R46DRAFT_1196529 [Mycena filopes]